ncbi:MAG: NADH-quinone oxidoreductase subunit NuoB [Nitrososphaerota archaeon]|nr:NADH-quinone oxidoreductase subunit NuoB [Nitrososphaerota archaeon]
MASPGGTSQGKKTLVFSVGDSTGAAFVGRLGEALKKAVEAPLGYVVNWGRLYSLWPVHMETGCCSTELGAVSGSRWDIERFGLLEAFGSLRQCDLLIVLGTVTRKMIPRLRIVWEQMPEPKWCMAVGACSISGGLYMDSYSVVQGIDQYIPVDVNVPGCPPTPMTIIDGVLVLMEKIRKSDLKGRYQAVEPVPGRSDD